MENQKTPNEQGIMILGLTSFVGCCCTSGILGVILSGIGLYLSNKDEKLIAENPSQYNQSSLNTWKIINIISLCISILTLIYAIYMKVTGKDVEQQQMLMEMIEKYRK
jgi:hypothetical protein